MLVVMLSSCDLTELVGYSTSEYFNLLRGMNVTSPNIFCLFMMDNMLEAVLSLSTITWNNLLHHNDIILHHHYTIHYLLPAVTSTAVNSLGAQVKFSISGPYTP